MNKSAVPDGKARISINIPEKLLKDMDSDCKANKQTRSSWITGAVMEKIFKEKRD